MKTVQLLAGSAVALALLASCEQRGYKIEGTGEALADGDTLFLTTDLTAMTPSDTIVIKDGKFTLSGQADSTFFCLLYSATNPELAMPFFIEPGNIRLTLPKDMEKARVEGTLCNQQWQVVNDSMAVMSKRMNQLAMQMYTATDEAQAAKLQGEVEGVMNKFRQFIFEQGKKNISNEFGYFVTTFYSDGLLEPEQVKELVGMLPEAMSQRQPVKQLKEQLNLLQNTAEGATIKDFRQKNLEGKEVSLLDEVRQHKLTVLDFWASWCGPCRQAMPHVVKLYESYKDKGLGIVGISLDEDGDSWAAAVQELGMTWLQMSDLKGWNNQIAKAFGVKAIPHMVVVDQQGRIVSSSIMADKLEPLLKERLQ